MRIAKGPVQRIEKAVSQTAEPLEAPMFSPPLLRRISALEALQFEVVENEGQRRAHAARKRHTPRSTRQSIEAQRPSADKRRSTSEGR